MCRNSDNAWKGIRQHFICLDCRRSVKSRYTPKCGDCGAEMKRMGFDFKPPRRANVKQWRKVEIMIDKGYPFMGCGCNRRVGAKSLGDAKRLTVSRDGLRWR